MGTILLEHMFDTEEIDYDKEQVGMLNDLITAKFKPEYADF